MSNDDYTDSDLEIRSLLPFFYPSSRTTPPDPCSTAARIEGDLRTNPENTAFIATTLPAFLFFTATSTPAHIDNVLHTTQILLHTSLPLVNIPHLCRPNATFASLFLAMFPDDFNASISGPVLVPERETYIAMSLLGARARSMDIINTPECVGKLAHGLGFSERVSLHYQSEQAEIAAMGSCIQLLGGASLLMRDQPVRFSKDKILDALDRLESGQNDALIKFTKRHLQKEPLVDLTSEEIVSLRSQGWPISGVAATDRIPRDDSTLVINACPVHLDLFHSTASLSAGELKTSITGTPRMVMV